MSAPQQEEGTINEIKIIKRDGSLSPVRFDEITKRLDALRDLEPKLKHVSTVFISQHVISKLTLSKDTSEEDDAAYEQLSTLQLDEISADIAQQYNRLNPEYSKLAARIVVSSLHKNVKLSFSQSVRIQYEGRKKLNDRTTRPLMLISDDFMSFVEKHKDLLDKLVEENLKNDYSMSFIGLQILKEQRYLRSLKKDFLPEWSLKLIPAVLLKKFGSNVKIIVETPQHMFMRVACSLWCGKSGGDDMADGEILAEINTTFQALSNRLYIHATPTLLNSGMHVQQLSSCFLFQMFDDTIEGIFETLKACALASKTCGGLGLAVSNIRAEGSYIHSSDGISSGVPGLSEVYQSMTKYVDQGGGKRKGALAMYMEPWHADMVKFCTMVDPNSEHSGGIKVQKIFTGLWIPDEFMRRVENSEEWMLFSPDEAPGLYDCHSEEFTALYKKYEKEVKEGKRRAFSVVNAREFFKNYFINTQSQRGFPYGVLKDACNRKSNLSTLPDGEGMIHSSNLCTEITLPTSKDEIAVCNLASINLANFVEPMSNEMASRYDSYMNPNASVDVVKLTPRVELVKCPPRPVETCNIIDAPIALFIKHREDDPLPSSVIRLKKLFDIAQVATKNLDRIIDSNYYVRPEMEISNKRHRPIGVGVQGLADLFNKCRLAWGSLDALIVDSIVFETILYGCYYMSNCLAQEHGPHPTYEHTQAAKGLLQPDLWLNEHNVFPEDFKEQYAKVCSIRACNWQALKKLISVHGLRNGELTTCMPTATTARIMGGCEGIEPYTQNYCKITLLSGEYTHVNCELTNLLAARHCWNTDIQNRLQSDNSCKNLPGLSDDEKEIFKTAYEIPPEILQNHLRTRSPFVTQNQSFNVFIDHNQKPNCEKICDLYLRAWRMGCKSFCYYMHQLLPSQAEQVSIRRSSSAVPSTRKSSKKLAQPKPRVPSSSPTGGSPSPAPVCLYGAGSPDCDACHA